MPSLILVPLAARGRSMFQRSSNRHTGIQAELPLIMHNFLSKEAAQVCCKSYYFTYLLANKTH